jgi:CheY-like chemotaxis protein
MKKLILIIEDDDEIRENIENILARNSYDVITASNGLIGLELAITNNPDLIICDVMMPGLDGFEVLQSLQNDIKTSNIPFLFLTARSSKEDIRQGMNLGADDYLTKPFEYSELINAVNSRLKKNESKDIAFREKVEELANTVHRYIPHEIRTPILTIIGNSELIQKNFDKLNKIKIIEMTQDIEDEANRLLSLFERFILLSELQMILANQEDLNEIKSNKTDLSELIIKSIGERKVKKYSRFQDLKIYTNNYKLAISEPHFERAIREVMDNAFKFSNTGTMVELFTTKMNNQVTFTIKDYGIGISKEEIKKLGTFSQLKRNTIEQKGVGLGLAIVRLIVQIYDGELIIKSNDKFTTVELTFNIA